MRTYSNRIVSLATSMAADSTIRPVLSDALEEENAPQEAQRMRDGASWRILIGEMEEHRVSSFEVLPTHRIVARILVSRRRNVDIRCATTYNEDQAWSGGSHTKSWCVDLQTRQHVSTPNYTETTSSTGFGSTGGIFIIPQGMIVVERVTFQGKDLGYRIVCHPRDVADFMPDPATAIPLRLRQILKVVAHYRGEYRQRELKALAPTSSERDSLISGGFLKIDRRGAMSITNEGRIACQ